MLKQVLANRNLTFLSIMRYFSIFVLSASFFMFTACNNEPKASEDKKEEKTDTTSKVETVKADKSLVAEWRLEMVNNVKDQSGLILNLTESGDFSMKQSDGAGIKGTYTNSEDGKKILLQSEKGSDTWTIVELTDSILVLSEIRKEDKKENLYRFKK